MSLWKECCQESSILHKVQGNLLCWLIQVKIGEFEDTINYCVQEEGYKTPVPELATQNYQYINK